MFLTALLEPFQFNFMVNALIVSTIVAVPCALLSVFLVLKGWALMGDAMSHAVFPGIVLAYIVGIPLAIGAFIAGLFCAVATGYLDDNSRIKRDTIMGIVFSGMFGAGLVLYVSIQSEVHLDHILFGDMLGISLSDIAQTALIALGIALIIAFKWKDLLLHAFDPHQAKACGLNTSLLHYGLLCMIALTIVATLKSVGVCRWSPHFQVSICRSSSTAPLPPPSSCCLPLSLSLRLFLPHYATGVRNCDNNNRCKILKRKKDREVGDPGFP